MPMATQAPNSAEGHPPQRPWNAPVGRLRPKRGILRAVSKTTTAASLTMTSADLATGRPVSLPTHRFRPNGATGHRFHVGTENYTSRPRKRARGQPTAETGHAGNILPSADRRRPVPVSPATP